MKAKDYKLSRTAWELLINEWIISPRDKSIVQDRIFEDLTYSEIADKHHLSEESVRKILTRCKITLEDAMRLP